MFLEESRINRYSPIEEVTNLMNEYHLEEADRMNYILAALRFYGLHEVMSNENTDSKMVFELPIFKGTINPTQLFDIKFSNGKIDFWQNLN